MKPNKRIEFAPFGRPTRKGEAPLLAAHSRRMNGQMQSRAMILVIATFMGGCVGHAAVLAPACEQPASLDGKWDPKTPGYIVMFIRDVDDPRSLAYELAAKYGFTPDSIYGAVKGFSVLELSPQALAGLRCEPKIHAVSFNEPTRVARNAL
jgi:hypothetical protein